MVTHCNIETIPFVFSLVFRTYIVSKVNIDSTIVSERFNGGTQGAPIMPRDAVSRTANVKFTYM